MQTRRKTPVKQTCQLDDSGEDAFAGSDKENTVNEVSRLKTGRKSKAKASADGRGATKRQKQSKPSQGTPPAFTFKAAKTKPRKRKQRNLERQREQDKKEKKRIEELVEYFKTLDEQELETV